MVTMQGMRLMLLVFALIGFAGAGAALGVARHRFLADGERDMGLGGIAAMFLAFGALCMVAAGGLSGILGFGGVAVWGSYMLTARKLGFFTIEAREIPSAEREPRQHHRT